MSNTTPIEWTDTTWNPVRGCSRKSEGCRNCYAERVAARFSGPGLAYEGLARRRSNGEAQWTGEVRLIEEHLEDPFRWRKPRRVFVNSMSDLFHESLSDSEIGEVFSVMARAKKHTFQILTKRPERMREFMLRYTAPGGPLAPTANGPLDRISNIWLGTSTENQETADERIPLLLQTPAAVRFISAEPLLGPIDLSPYIPSSDGFVYLGPEEGPVHVGDGARGLDWVIVGGESGLGARACDIAWIRDIVDTCRINNGNVGEVPVFVKQLGSVPMISEESWRSGSTRRLASAKNRHRVPEGFIPIAVTKKGGNIEEFPADLRRREFPKEVARV